MVPSISLFFRRRKWKHREVKYLAKVILWLARMAFNEERLQPCLKVWSWLHVPYA